MKPLTKTRILLLGIVFASLGMRMAQADLSENLVAYWPFDDNTADLMGRHHAIPMSDSVTLKEGKFGKAVSFDGESESYLDILNAADSELEVVGSSKTISIWISPDQLRSLGNAVPFSRRGLGTWEVFYNCNSLGKSVGYYAERLSPRFSTFLEEAKWVHIVCVSDRAMNEDQLYLNGELVSVGTENYSDPRYNNENVKRRCHIGRSAADRNASWSGLVDDVAVWDRALTSDEVTTLWNEGEGLALGSTHEDLSANGIPDFWESAYDLDDATENDADGDGLSNLEEYRRGTIPVSRDSDGDGLSDAVESGTGLWKDANDRGTSPYLMDSDADGLVDLVEDPTLPFISGTQPGSDPNQSDSDRDGLNDGEEFAQGLDPTFPDPATLKYQSGLVAYWPFEGSLEAARSFENVEVTAEMSNDATATFGPGKFGKGILLDGSSAVMAAAVDLEGNDLFAFPKQSYSVSGWWKGTRFTDRQQGLITSGGQHRWNLITTTFLNEPFLLFDPGTADALGPNAVGRDILSNGFPERFGVGIIQAYEESLEIDRLHHVAAVYNSRTGVFETYLDSVKLELQSLSTGATIRRNDKLWIGSSYGFDFWEGTIDDVAIWSRTLLEAEIEEIYNNGRGRPLSELLSDDADGDGMTDNWETANGLNPLVNDSESDLDGDGLTNGREFELRTLPNKEDTDDDGLLDGVETLTTVWLDSTDTGTDPRVADTDGDGYLDGFEISEIGTDPNFLDSDGDGLADPTEVRFDSDPKDGGSLPNLAAGLKAHWPLDGNLLDKQLAFHGNGLGDRSLSFVDSERGKGVRLDGESQYIEFQDSAEAFDFINQSFSVSLWYQPESYEGIDTRSEMRASIIGKGGGENEGAWSIERRKETALYQGSAAPFIMEQPNHLLLVADHLARTQRFFLNGELIETRDGSGSLKRFNPKPVSLMIGVDPNETQRDHFQDRDSIFHPFIKGVIDDVAIWDRPLADAEVQEIAKWTSEIEALLERPDKDNDGVDDAWEVHYGLDPESDDANDDLDADGLTNLEEYVLRTNPTNEDTDNDSLIDSAESATGRWVSLSDTGTDPLRSDTDGDGYSDAIERPDLGYASVTQPGTDPNRNDTDGDGAPDGEEGAAGTDPTNADDTPSNFQVTAEWGGSDDFQNLGRWFELETYDEVRETLEFSRTYPLPVINVSGALGPSVSDRFPNNLDYIGQEESQDSEAFFMQASGTFNVTTPGEWTFGVSALAGGDLRIDGKQVALAGNPGRAFATVELTSGPHQIDFFVWKYFSVGWTVFAEVFVALEPGKFESFEDAPFVLLRPSSSDFLPIESELIVQEIERNSNHLKIQWASKPSTLYNVEFSRTLKGPWDVIARDLVAPTIQSSWSDTDLERLRNRSAFYRVCLANKEL